MIDKIVFDKVSFKDSVRSIDDNGFLHVAISNISKEQVAPYMGHEIPNYERLGLKPDEIYNVYRPAEELKKAVISSNGIPIQLDHHADFADNPAKETRVGSTGTDGIFNAPYLQNSLHIQDAEAIKRINDGSMRELSLAYRYTPVKKSGIFDGEKYDLVMTDISCNHLALVEEGRAGHDVLVKDSKPKNLTEDQNMDHEVEQKELELADQVIALAQKLKDLHKVDAKGNVVDITHKEEISTMEEKLNEFLQKLEDAGIDKDEAKAQIEEIFALKDKTAEDEDLEVEAKEEEKEDLGVDEDDLGEEKGEIEEEEDLGVDEDDLKEEEKEDVSFDEDQKEALDRCGMDKEDPLIQKAFAEGVKYGERKEKEEPKHLDSLHESEGEKRALGEDSIAKITKSIHDKVKAEMSAKIKAVNACKKSLGNVDPLSFDNAGSVYRMACRKEGLNTKGMTAKECRAMYLGYMASHKNVLVGDKKTVKDDLADSFLNNVKDSI